MNPIRCRLFVVLAMFLPMILLAGGVQGQDSKAKGVLPLGWGKLGLSDEQKTKIYEIQTAYEPKLEAISKKLHEEKAKAREEMEAVLTPEQKQKLKEIKFNKFDPKP